MKAKDKKLRLDCDRVNSKSFHVGIELELKVQGDDDDGEREHDDDACHESQESYYADQSPHCILMDYFNLSRAVAEQVAAYFDQAAWVNNMMQDWVCDDSDCAHYSGGGDGDAVRSAIEADLIAQTGNRSVKVVSDSSIDTENGGIDAEVCWNYFAHKETFADNKVILDRMSSEFNAKFDSSCGLHINLNNYLKVPQVEIPTSALDFLFNLVAPSRRKSTYCNRAGMSCTNLDDNKYSMIYHQTDRLEFRFFSPTLDAEKLHHYVVVANTVYKRLAGKASKLPKATADYILNKMTTVNGKTVEDAAHTIACINDIKYAMFYEVPKVVEDEVNVVIDETNTLSNASSYYVRAVDLGAQMITFSTDTEEEAA